MWYGIPLTQWTSLFLKGACDFSCEEVIGAAGAGAGAGDLSAGEVG